MNKIESVHQQFGDNLLNFVKSKVSSIQDAEDIYQDVIYKISTKGDQLNNAQSLKSWLFTITRNQIMDYYRKRKDSLDIESAGIFNSLQQEVDLNAYHEIEPCLRRFIEALPDEYRRVIVLSEIEGLSQKKVADTLGLNYVTLRSRVQRGRERLRKMIVDACIIEQGRNGGLVDCTPNRGSSKCTHGSKPGCN